MASGGLGAEGGAAPPHVFQSLLYLRKLCSHPLLVLDPAVPQHMQVGWGGAGGQAEEEGACCFAVPCSVCPTHVLVHLPAPTHPPSQAVHKVLGSKHGGDWATAQAALRSNLAHSPKLAALQELLLDAGGCRTGWGGWVGRSNAQRMA